MSLVEGSRYLLKHANCVDDGLPLTNWFLNCSESEITFKCFYVQKVSTFYLIFLFLLLLFEDGAMKMWESKQDLEWELTPYAQLSLCTAKVSK